MAKQRFEYEADIKDIIAKLGKLREEFEDTGDTGEEQAKKIGSSFADIFKGSFASDIAMKGLGMVTSAVGDVKAAMIDGNAEMETYTTQFSTLLGSTEAAEKRLGELAKFGAETPFELPEIAKAEKVLLGFGLTGEKVMQMTGKNAEGFRSLVGDIAAGTGASFEEIALNMGKLSSGATGEAISRFQEMGIATREQLKAMGVEFSKSGELLSPLPVAMQAITKLTSEKFGGGMKALSGTFNGLKSTLSDTLAEMGRTMGKPIFDAAKGGLIKVLDFLGSPETKLVLANITKGVSNLFSVFQSGTSAALSAANAQQELNKRMQDYTRSQIDATKGIKSLATEYEGLAGKATRTREEQQRMDEILRKINAVMPDVITSNKSYSGSLDEVQKAAAMAGEKIGKLQERLRAQMLSSLELQKTTARLSVQQQSEDLKKAASQFVFAASDSAEKRGATFGALGQAIGSLWDSASGKSEEMRKLQDAIISGSQSAIDKLEKYADRLNQAGEVEQANVALGMLQKMQEIELSRENLAVTEAQITAERERIKNAKDLTETKTGGPTGAPPPPPPGSDPKAIAEAQKRLAAYHAARIANIDDAYLREDAQRTESRRLLQQEFKNKEIDERTYRERLLGIDREFIGRASKAVLEGLKGDAKAKKDDADRHKDLLERKVDLEEKHAEKIAELNRRAWENQRKEREEEQRKYAESVEEQRRDFEDKFAGPVSDLGGQVFRSLFDKQVTGAERAKMVWEGLGNIAIDVLTDLGTQFLKNTLMSIATQATVIPAAIATGAATAAAWAPAAAMVSLGTFGANSIAASAGIASTTALAQALSIPMFDEGAVAMKPTLAVIAEKRPEFVGALDDLVEVFRKSVGVDGSTRTPINKRKRNESFGASIQIGVDTFGRGSRSAQFRKMRTQR